MSDLLALVAFICTFISLLCRCWQLKRENVVLKIKLVNPRFRGRTSKVYRISQEDELAVATLKREHNKIAAIRLLKDNYKMSLFESKIYVDII